MSKLDGIKRFCENCKHFEGRGNECGVSKQIVSNRDICTKWAGLRFVSVVGADGVRFQTPVPEIQRMYIPDGWLDLSWHIAVTINKPRLGNSPTWDQLAYAELMALGLPVIMATHDVKTRLNGNGKRKRYCSYIEKLLMPGYLLVGLARNDDALLAHLMQTRNACAYVGGVLVNARGYPLKVGNSQIKRLAYELNVGEHRESIKQVKPDNLPTIGDLVKINGGFFDGKVGAVDNFKDKYIDGKRRVCKASVMLKAFGSERAVDFDVDSLEICS